MSTSQAFIVRNLTNWSNKEAVHEDVIARCKAFSEGALLFWPHMSCELCRRDYNLKDMQFRFEEDPEDNHVPCEMCACRYEIELTITAMYPIKKGVELPWIRKVLDRSLNDEDVTTEVLEELKLDELKAEASEIVHLIGPIQLKHAFLQLCLATPLLLVNSIELIKQQPTLAYNLAYYNLTIPFPEALHLMRAEVNSLLFLADSEKFNQTDVNTMIMPFYEILPECCRMKQEYEEEKEKEEEKEDEKYVMLQNEDFKDNNSKEVEEATQAIENLTIHIAPDNSSKEWTSQDIEF
jgi:hypothetical protein